MSLGTYSPLENGFFPGEKKFHIHSAWVNFLRYYESGLFFSVVDWGEGLAAKKDLNSFILFLFLGGLLKNVYVSFLHRFIPFRVVNTGHYNKPHPYDVFQINALSELDLLSYRFPPLDSSLFK